MISGKLAAEAIIEAKAAGDFSAVGLSRYQELLEESFVLQDLYTIRNVTPFAHARPWLLNEVPEVLSRAMREYLTVDDDPKRVKQGKILRILRDGFPVGRTLGDAVGALRLLR